MDDDSGKDEVPGRAANHTAVAAFVDVQQEHETALFCANALLEIVFVAVVLVVISHSP